MDDPFKTASSLVGDLKVEYNKLNKELPRLRELYKGAKSDLDAINRDTISAQEKLDKLLEDIKVNTETYNKWQADEYAKLNKTRLDIKTDRKALDNDKAEHITSVNNHLKMAGIADSQIRSERQSIDQDRKEVQGQQSVNNKWAEKLKLQEIKNSETKTLADNRDKELDERSNKLDIREQSIAGAEEEAAKIIADAEKERNSARVILSDAKETVANNDAREQANDIKERLLDERERKLNKIKAGLDDRAGVLSSNSL
jgi:uncharacterized protein (DUF3084 family)